MTPAQQVAIGLYSEVYTRMDPEWCDIRNDWPSEVRGYYFGSEEVHDWTRPAHKELLSKAENILRLVDYDLTKALAIFDAL